jgi:tetratricopeptide (TPR) repeat protein
MKANRELAEGKLDKADEYVQKALAMAPQFARAMTVKAVILMAKHDFPSALQLTEKAAKVDPMLGLTHVVMASALNGMGRAKEAQAAAEQGLRLDGSWQGHYELARAMMTQHHYKHALREITKAMAAGPPRFGELMLLWASALMNLRDVAGAREALAEFMKVRPGDPRGTRMMAVLNAK